MKKNILSISMLAILIIASCSDEESTPSKDDNNGNDSITVSFSKDIKPIIDAKCIYCHKSTSPQLSTYDQIAQNAERILGAIKHESGYKPMPQGGAKLADSLINKFEIWVSNGKPNN